MSASWLWLSASIVALAGTVLLVWALIGDRSKGRRRCPRCWYDLSATEGRRCSECGREAKSEQRLFKSRRRWRWAFVAALVLLFAGGLGVTAKAQRDGWDSVTPSTLLILIAKYSDDPWALAALAERGKYSDLWNWQWRWAAQVALRDSYDRNGGPWQGPWKRSCALLVLGLAASSAIDLDEPAVLQAFQSALKDSDPSLRMMALYAFPASRFHDEAYQTVSPMLNDPQRLVRQAASHCLSRLARVSDQAVALLISRLRHEQSLTRIDAADEVGRLIIERRAGDDAINALIDVARHDSDSEVRAKAIRVLTHANIRRPDVWEVMAVATSDSDPMVRGDAIDALLQLEAPAENVVPVVLRILKDESLTVREHASYTLRDSRFQSEFEKHRQTLRELLVPEEDPSLEPGASIRDLLNRIGWPQGKP